MGKGKGKAEATHGEAERVFSMEPTQRYLNRPECATIEQNLGTR